MSVTHGSHTVVVTQSPVSSLKAWDVANVGNGRGRRARVSGIPLRRSATVGHAVARPAVSERHPCDQAFNATAVWRSCNIEGYLERKLHRQWRTRGS